MGLKDIQPGTYTAKAFSARLIKAKTEALAVEILFKFGNEQLPWQGWLSPKALDRTMETLTNVLGYNGDETLDENGIFVGKNCFDWEREVNVVVELESYKNEAGEDRTVPKIRWVNKVGSGQAFKSMNTGEAKTMLQQVGFKAAFMAQQQKNKQTESKPTDTDIPW